MFPLNFQQYLFRVCKIMPHTNVTFSSRMTFVVIVNKTLLFLFSSISVALSRTETNISPKLEL